MIRLRTESATGLAAQLHSHVQFRLYCSIFAYKGGCIHLWLPFIGLTEPAGVSPIAPYTGLLEALFGMSLLSPTLPRASTKH